MALTTRNSSNAFSPAPASLSFHTPSHQGRHFQNINTFLSSAASIDTNQNVESSLPSGLIKQVTNPGRGSPICVGDIVTVRYTCTVVEDNTNAPLHNVVPFAKSSSQKFVVGDGLMIDGWELALQSMRGGERSVVRISDPLLSYGVAGVPPIIPENAIVQLDIDVLEVEAGVDLGTIASADPLKPRTPSSIAAAYNTRRENAMLNDADKKKGLEAWIAKFKTFYFFGFFEGETGQKAPWYLRPSITFPIAFAIVGAAFWVAYAGGGIYNRGAQIKDELDEFIVTMNGNSGVDVDTGLIQQVLVMSFFVSTLVSGNGF